MTYQEEGELYIDASEELIKKINQKEISTANNFIISSQQHFIGDELLKNKR